MLTYNIEERGGAPIYKYLYENIKADIITGRLAAGERLPSKRTFAEHLGVSTVTVEGAYSLLEEEGYIAARERSGYFVCDLGMPAVHDAAPAPEPVEETSENTVDMPVSVLARITRRVMASDIPLWSKPPYNGCAVLRNAISGFLQRYRGLTVKPENIVIGSGSQHLYMMTVQFLGRDRIYGIEDPSYDKIRMTYETCGAGYELLPLDKYGIASAALARTSASVLHVTPFRSFPTGVTAPAFKRLEYLRWASEPGRVIIEDDYASEFYIGGKPVETIFSMDRHGVVIYMNTFTRSLAPSIRIGYMLLPDSLASQYREKLGFYSCTVPVADQYVLAEFISGGYFERHLNRIRKKLRQSGGQT